MKLTPDIWYSIGTVVLGAIVALLGYVTRVVHQLRKRGDKKREIPLALSLRRDIEINVILDRALQNLGSRTMRVYLSMLHNGDKYLDGSEIIRKSRTHERVRPGVSYQHEEFRGVLITRVSDEMEMITNPGPSWTIVNEMQEGLFKDFCTRGGVTAVARVAILRRGDLVGFVGADFDSDLPPETLGSLLAYTRQIDHVLVQYATNVDDRQREHEKNPRRFLAD